tara:strand:- start:57 stop:533 length:477 start_codon:yes stop_codon:yes gene_type:complete
MAHGTYNNPRAGSSSSKERMRRMVRNLEPEIPLHNRPSKLPRRPRPMEKVETKPAKTIETTTSLPTKLSSVPGPGITPIRHQSGTTGEHGYMSKHEIYNREGKRVTGAPMSKQEIKEEKAYVKGEKKKQKIDKRTEQKFNKFTKKEKIKEARKEFRGK